MPRCDPSQVSRVGIVGTGVIGGGWAMHFLAQGLDVVVFDPDPETGDKIGAHDRLRLAFPGKARPEARSIP